MYWEKAGPANSEATVELAINRAKELNIKHLVVASRTGKTIKLCLNREFELVCVTHHVGYLGPGIDEMEAGIRQKLTESGVKLLTTTHLMAGLDRGVRTKFKGIYPSEIIAESLRMLGQGVKVCVEISVMALDAGLIPYGEEVVAISGTNNGADTAAVILPAHSNDIFRTKVKEIICKPRN